MMFRPLRALCRALPVIGLAAAAGCSTYTIKGTVVSGDKNHMTFVAVEDPRLREPPLNNVRLTVQRDPDKLSRKLVGTDLSDAYGRFTIPIDEFGTGWMDEKWLIRATKDGFETTSAKYELTADRKKMKLLVIMRPGLSVIPQEDEDLMEEFDRHR
jgi:hypothetical protein